MSGLILSHRGRGGHRVQSVARDEKEYSVKSQKGVILLIEKSQKGVDLLLQ